MIINREHAEAAATLLEVSLDGLDEAAIKSAYRLAAARTHPDAGGTIEAFAAVDRAKHVLGHWLARRGADAAPKAVLQAGKCPRCAGKGRVTLHRGFTPYQVRCNTCYGTGDGGYDHDRAKE